MTKEEFIKIRKKAGFAQWDMATYLKVSQSQVSLYELGRKPIPQDVAVKVGKL